MPRAAWAVPSPVAWPSLVPRQAALCLSAGAKAHRATGGSPPHSSRGAATPLTSRRWRCGVAAADAAATSLTWVHFVQVVLLDVQPPKDMAAVVDHIQSAGGEALALQCDVRDRAQVRGAGAGGGGRGWPGAALRRRRSAPKGWHCLASNAYPLASRRPGALCNANVYQVPFLMSCPQVDDAVRQAFERFGRLDVMVANAGKCVLPLKRLCLASGRPSAIKAHGLLLERHRRGGRGSSRRPELEGPRPAPWLSAHVDPVQCGGLTTATTASAAPPPRRRHPGAAVPRRECAQRQLEGGDGRECGGTCTWEACFSARHAIHAAWDAMWNA